MPDPDQRTANSYGQRDSPQLLCNSFADRFEGVPDLVRVHEHLIAGAGQCSCSLLEGRQVLGSKLLLLRGFWALCAVDGETLLEHVHCRCKDGAIPAAETQISVRYHHQKQHRQQTSLDMSLRSQ